MVLSMHTLVCLQHMTCSILTESAGLLGEKLIQSPFAWRNYAITLCSACHLKWRTAYV
jgi:hypothetical protein